MEVISVNNISISGWNVGFCNKLRPIWKEYFVKAEAVIYIIDYNDRDSIEYAQEEQLNKLLNEEWLDKKTFFDFR